VGREGRLRYVGKLKGGPTVPQPRGLPPVVLPGWPPPPEPGDAAPDGHAPARSLPTKATTLGVQFEKSPPKARSTSTPSPSKATTPVDPPPRTPTTARKSQPALAASCAPAGAATPRLGKLRKPRRHTPGQHAKARRARELRREAKRIHKRRRAKRVASDVEGDDTPAMLNEEPLVLDGLVCLLTATHYIVTGSIGTQMRSYSLAMDTCLGCKLIRRSCLPDG